ncbi:MAG: putative ABC transporter permease [Oscillospiraceae bacterium]|nr:putative ABC transporter permease [Oscillospiraceae bacterium]
MLTLTKDPKVSKTTTLPTLFLWFMFYSVFGWVWESIVVSIEFGYWTNRGFLFGPLLPIYGTGAVLALVILSKRIQSLPLLFLAGGAIATILEYITSAALELIFNQRWWDYSQHRFHLHGRVSLLATVVFGVMIVLLIKVVHPHVERLTDRISDGTRQMLALGLVGVIAVDFLVTVVGLVTVSY